MRALIVGATGLVGHALWRDWKRRPGWEVYGTYHARPWPGLEALDILDAAAVGDVFRRVRPEAVVLAASNPFVDYCETHAEETRRINVDATLRAAEAARSVGARLIFFSSDYVFDGTRASYGESDPVRPLNEYGRQKVEAERGIAQEIDEHIILRISGAFGWELARKNFVLQILDRAASKLPIRAATDVVNRPTYAPALAAVSARLLETGARGLFHAAGSEEWSRYDFALEVARRFGLEDRWIEPVRMASLGAPAARPPHSSLKSQRLPSEAQELLWGARRALEHMQETQAEWRDYTGGTSAASNRNP